MARGTAEAAREAVTVIERHRLHERLSGPQHEAEWRAAYERVGELDRLASLMGRQR